MPDETVEVVCYVEIGRFQAKTTLDADGQSMLTGLTPEEKALLCTADFTIVKELNHPPQLQ